MVKEGFPFVVVPFAAAAILAVAQIVAGISVWLWAGVAVFALTAGFMAFFFRDPERSVPEGDNIIVSAADGKVTRVERTGDSVTVSVFLSPLDVHVNRAPVGGTISSVEYVAGRKIPATSDAASFVNERNSLMIEGDEFPVTCTQIAGIVARRIVCWRKAGDTLALGERFGLIKFSSRTDLKMPAGVELEVRVGDRVRGGETIIARYVQQTDHGDA